MVTERSSIMDEALPVAAHVISEIKDAVRELRTVTPDSVLAELAEQKIDEIVRVQAHDCGIGHAGAAERHGL